MYKIKKFAKTIGFSGQIQLISMPAPVCIQAKNKSVTIPVLVSNQTPVNVLGRDALRKLGLQIWCSPEGVYTDLQGIGKQMMVYEPKANVYWMGQIENDVGQVINTWGKFIEAHISEAQLPKSEFHCTMIYDSESDTKIERNSKRKLEAKILS